MSQASFRGSHLEFTPSTGKVVFGGVVVGLVLSLVLLGDWPGSLSLLEDVVVRATVAVLSEVLIVAVVVVVIVVVVLVLVLIVVLDVAVVVVVVVVVAVVMVVIVVVVVVVVVGVRISSIFLEPTLQSSRESNFNCSKINNK